MVLLFSRPWILSVARGHGGRCPRCARHRCRRGEVSRAPTVALVEKLVFASVNTAEVSAVAVHRRGCSSSSC